MVVAKREIFISWLSRKPCEPGAAAPRFVLGSFPGMKGCRGTGPVPGMSCVVSSEIRSISAPRFWVVPLYPGWVRSSDKNHRIPEHPKLEGIHKNHRVQLQSLHRPSPKEAASPLLLLLLPYSTFIWAFKKIVLDLFEREDTSTIFIYLLFIYFLTFWFHKLMYPLVLVPCDAGKGTKDEVRKPLKVLIFASPECLIILGNIWFIEHLLHWCASQIP